MIAPYYSTLSQADLDTMTALIDRFGYAPVISGIADILTQTLGPGRTFALSLELGRVLAAAQQVDDAFPPKGQ